MSLIDIFKTVLFNLKANKGRSALSVLGIVIGIASVIVIISAGAGAQNLILNQIKDVGTDVFAITPGKSEENGPPISAFGIVITTLTESDASAIKKEVPYVINAVGIANGVSALKWKDKSIDSKFIGTSESYSSMQNLSFESGRFFAREEENSFARVVILGNSVKNDLFGDSDPIGEKIKIKKENFTVIGVLKFKGSNAFQDLDSQVYVPLSTAQNFLLGINHVNNIVVKFDNPSHLDYVSEKTAAVLRARHKINDSKDDDFSIKSPQQALDALTSITDALKFFLAGIAAISLVVGGIGIMNIMLISVTERTREIGLRKALGATKNSILFQFLIETAAMSSLGGIIGIIAGILITFAIAVIANAFGFDWNFIISILSIIAAVSVSFAIGLIFGIWPAHQAARKEPIEALRYE